MKIGIITIQKCNNFGAELQAYALQKKLQLMGYDAENIDYVFYKNPAHRKTKRSRPSFKLSLVNRVKEFLFPILKPFKANPKFEKFVSEHIKLSKSYVTMDALYADPPKYDVYVVGSDQVWNPRTASNLEPYFLTFAPEGAKCVAYASSLGVSEIPAGAFYRYKQWLKRFNAIGVREKSGADIVKAMALGVEVKHVVDPTLLLSAAEWTNVACAPKDSCDEPYILLYDLIPSEETVALARRVSEKLGARVIRIGADVYGPSEFVWLFAHAKAVVTNSFHGTVFSVLNNKSFYSVVPRGMTNAGRIESLLTSLGLMDRLVHAEECKSFDLDLSIDYRAVKGRLDELRGESVDFLSRAINEPRANVPTKLPLGCYAVWNVDDAVRTASTSGGLFRILAEDTIRQGGVVYGAAFAPDFHSVAHQAAETIEALDPLMKSKYVWSDPTAAYKEAISQLKVGRKVLFTGTPCQIAAIKALARGCDDNLLTMDIVCHGTPRPEIFAAYAAELEDRFGGKISKYEFRNKDAGWNFPRVKCEFSQGGGV